MGRGKIEIKRIDKKASRQATFCKRRAGLLKKAHELAVLCDAQVGVVIFSGNGKLFDYGSPSLSLMELIHRYEITTRNTRLQETDRDDQMFMEITRLRNEKDQLEASLRRQTGEDLSSVATVDELSQLQLQLESALTKVRQRKDELMNQQLEELRHSISGNWQSSVSGEAPAMEALTAAAVEAEAFGHNCFFPEEEDDGLALQLWPLHN